MLAGEHTAAIGPQLEGKHEENDTGLPTCPICLADILNLQDKAVVSSCMHAFCLHCLLRWLDYKRSCPLCKGRVSSYFYRITEQGEYNERVVPLTPPREQPPEPRGVPRIDEARSQVAPSASLRSSVMDHSFWAHPTRPEAQRHRHSSGGGGRSEPRPYFHRVRAMMTAPGSRAAGGGAALHPADPTAAGEEQSLLWRRHIYLQGLYALPLKLERPVAAAAGAPASQRRIEEWVQRELRAVLRIEDVSLLRSFVMGLAVSARLAAAWNPRPGQPVDEGAHAEAVAALRPFLNAEAGQFWHELRCFAGSPYSLSTYDRLVQYQRGRPTQGALAPAIEAGSHDGYTLWTARQSAAPSQAAQPITVAASASPGQGRRDALPQRQDPHRPPHLASSSGRQSRWDRPACQPDPASSRRSRRDEDQARQGSAPARQAEGKDGRDHRRKRCRDEHRCCAGGSGGRRGLCLDCAERQAAEEEQRQAGRPSMPAADPPATAAGLRATAAAARNPGQQARDPMLAASGQVDSAAISRLAAERLRALLGPDAPSTSAADSPPASSMPASELEPPLPASDTRPTEPQSRSSQSMADLGVIDLCSDSDDEVVLVTATMQSVRGQKHQHAYHEPQLPMM